MGILGEGRPHFHSGKAVVLPIRPDGLFLTRTAKNVGLGGRVKDIRDMFPVVT
jgi:hypothetical protein